MHQQILIHVDRVDFSWLILTWLLKLNENKLAGYVVSFSEYNWESGQVYQVKLPFRPTHCQ